MNLKYQIVQDFLPICKIPPRRRGGDKITKVGFIVSHDTGNLNSTAKGNVKYYKDTYNKESASAHLFVDDKEIIECVPVFQNTEKAWHVLYDKPLDNQLFGDDACDIAIGVELCFFTDKNRSQLAYAKYVWLLSYLCYFFKLNPEKDIIGHETLDPQRKIDPSNGLKYSGHTYKDLIKDVSEEFNKINGKSNNGDVIMVEKAFFQKMKVVASSLNIRNKPTTEDSTILGQFANGEIIVCTGVAIDNWYRCVYSNQDGFVSGKYLELYNEPDYKSESENLKKLNDELNSKIHAVKNILG